VAEVVARGVRFHVLRLGRGETTVVFLHGLVADNLSSFYFTLANPTARNAQVLLYDLRGHGKSERTPAGYGVADMVADLAAILDVLGITRPVQLVGNSFGGLLALAFAIAQPGRVAGIVLIDAHRGEDGWGDAMTETLLLQGEERDRWIASAFANWPGRHSARKSNRLEQTAAALVRGTSLVADLKASAPLSDADLASVCCPTLALYGEKSDIRAGGEDLARILPTCELRILPGCTHLILREETELLERLVVEWLSGTAWTAPPSAPAKG